MQKVGSRYWYVFWQGPSGVAVDPCGSAVFNPIHNRVPIATMTAQYSRLHFHQSQGCLFLSFVAQAYAKLLAGAVGDEDVFSTKRPEATPKSVSSSSEPLCSERVFLCEDTRKHAIYCEADEVVIRPNL